MSTDKLVTILGVTSRQGRSAAKYLLKDGTFRIRGTTRDPAKARDLKDKGVEIFKADGNNADELRKAFEGSYAVFAITFFWDPSQKSQEFQAGKLAADIAKEKGVKHFIFSSLPNVEKICRGKYHVPHFTDKARVEEYARSLNFEYTTFPQFSFFFENFKVWFLPKEDSDGTMVFSFPAFPKTAFLTAFSVDEGGQAVVSALKNPEKWNGKTVPLVGTHATVQEYVDTFGKVMGKKVKYVETPRNSLGEEMQEMLDWFTEYTFYGPNPDFEIGRGIGKFSTWEEWLKEGNWEK